MNRVKYAKLRTGEIVTVSNAKGGPINSNFMSQEKQRKPVRAIVEGKFGPIIKTFLPETATRRRLTVAETDLAMHKKGYVRLSSLNVNQRKRIKSIVKSLG